MAAGDHSPPSSNQPAPPPTQDPYDVICGCCFCVSIVLFFVGLLVYLLMPVPVPKPIIPPRFDLQQVGVQYLIVSVNDPTPTAFVSLDIRMVFMAENDNHGPIWYRLSSFNITYRGIPLGWATLPGFYQGGKDVERVQTTMTVDRVNLDHAADFVRDDLLNDRVELRIMGDVDVYMVTQSWRGMSMATTTVSLDCVIAISPRKQALTCKLCGSDVLKV